MRCKLVITTYYMAEFVFRSWCMPMVAERSGKKRNYPLGRCERAIRFFSGPVSFGGKISEFSINANKRGLDTFVGKVQTITCPGTISVAILESSLSTVYKQGK